MIKTHHVINADGRSAQSHLGNTTGPYTRLSIIWSQFSCKKPSGPVKTSTALSSSVCSAAHFKIPASPRRVLIASAQREKTEQLEWSSDDCYNKKKKNHTLMEKKEVNWIWWEQRLSVQVCVCVCVRVCACVRLRSFVDVCRRFKFSREQFSCKPGQFKCSSTRKRSSLPFCWGLPLTRLSTGKHVLANQHQPADIKSWWSGSQGLHLLIFPQHQYTHEALKMQLDCQSLNSIPSTGGPTLDQCSDSARALRTYSFAFVIWIFKSWPIVSVVRTWAWI